MNSFSHLPDKELIKLLNQNNKDAFEHIFKFYYNDLCNYLLYLIKDKDTVEQLVQELFVYIWENRESFSPKGNLKSYFFKSCKNKALNYYKHEGIKSKHSDALKLAYYNGNINLPEEVERKELESIIEQGLDLLPHKCREVFILVKRNGFTYAEAAEILDISRKTVENQMGKALQRLRKFIKPYLK